MNLSKTFEAKRRAEGFRSESKAKSLSNFGIRRKGEKHSVYYHWKRPSCQSSLHQGNDASTKFDRAVRIEVNRHMGIPQKHYQWETETCDRKAPRTGSSQKRATVTTMYMALYEQDLLNDHLRTCEVLVRLCKPVHHFMGMLGSSNKRVGFTLGVLHSPTSCKPHYSIAHHALQGILGFSDNF